MAVKAVIFDFDGVIADTESCHLAAFNRVFAQFGIEIAQDMYYSTYLGFTDCEMIADVQRDFNANFKGKTIEQLAEDKAVIFHKLITSGECIIDGIPEFIADLKKNNIRIAINSGAIAADITLILRGTKIEKDFEFVVSADDVEKGKPDPQGYLLALKKLNSNAKTPIVAKECVVLEDSKWGIIAGKDAGMNVIGVTNSYPAKELVGSDLIVDSVRKITVAGLNKLCS